LKLNFFALRPQFTSSRFYKTHFRTYIFEANAVKNFFGLASSHSSSSNHQNGGFETPENKQRTLKRIAQS